MVSRSHGSYRSRNPRSVRSGSSLGRPDPTTTLERIRRPTTELFVSAASAWEVGTKFRLGKLDEASGVVHGYQDHLARLRARELSITGTTP